MYQGKQLLPKRKQLAFASFRQTRWGLEVILFLWDHEEEKFFPCDSFSTRKIVWTTLNEFYLKAVKCFPATKAVKQQPSKGLVMRKKLISFLDRSWLLLKETVGDRFEWMRYSLCIITHPLRYWTWYWIYTKRWKGDIY